MDNDSISNTEEADLLVSENEHIFDMKDQIMKVLNNQSSEDCMHALQFALTDLICSVCIDRDSALNVASAFAMQTGLSIVRLDESGLCFWNNEHPVQ